MKKVERSTDRNDIPEHHMRLEIPHVVVKNIYHMCREKEDEINTKAASSRYGGLANMIEREMNKTHD